MTKLSAKNAVVTSYNCRNVDVNMSHKKSGVADWDVDVDVTRKGGLIDSVWFASGSNTKRARSLICPSTDGLGKYVLGPSAVWANNSSYSRYVSRPDHTKGSFYVRGTTYASLSSKRSGKTVTLTSKTKVYNPEKYGKVNYNPKVKFQVKSGSKWKTLKTVTAKKGQGHVQGTVEGQEDLSRHLQPGQLGDGSDFEVGQALTISALSETPPRCCAGPDHPSTVRSSLADRQVRSIHVASGSPK